MNHFLRLRSRSRLVAGILLSASVLLIAACQPIVDPALMEAEQPATEESESAAEPTFEVEPAKATINASSLRVRQGPSDAYELIAGVKQGETYGVLSMTSDGAWIQLAVDRSPDGQGWVSTEFVTLEGDITNIATVEPEESAASEVETSGGEHLVSIGEALIETPLPLRVRSAPTDAEDNKIGNVLDGETYPVLELSEDGAWLKIDVPELSEVGGWIAADNAIFTDLDSDDSETEAADAVDTADADTDMADDADADTDMADDADADTDMADDADADTDMADDADTDEEEASPTELSAGMMALIQTPLPLRVRSAPTTEEENKIGSVYNDEIWKILEVSEDGLWLKLDVPHLSEDGGWISAEYAFATE